MNEDNMYSDGNEPIPEEERRKVSLDKTQQGIYEEGVIRQRGEYRQTREEDPGAYHQNEYSGDMQTQADSSPYQPENQGLGIASMVLGILSLVLFCACINIPLAIVAIVLGVFQLCKPGAKKGMAIAGIVTSILSLVLFAVSVLVFISSVDFSEGTTSVIENRIGEDFFDQYDGGNFFDRDDGDDFLDRYDFPEHHEEYHRTF